MSTKKITPEERLNALLGEKKPAVEKNQKIKTATNIITPKKQDGRKNNGGKGDVGRKPGGQALARRTLRQILANHYAEEIEIEIEDPKTGTLVKLKKPRVLAMMEKMYEIAVKTGDSAAGDRWLNRALGKAPQPLIGDEEEDPIRVDLGVDRILGKVYNDEEDQEDDDEGEEA